MAHLQITSEDPDKAQKFEFHTDEITIGRSPDNVIHLDDPSVSSKHCTVVRDGRKYTVRDLGATNTTRLNNVRIAESRLKPQDIILIGSVAIMFDGEDVEVDETVSLPSGTRLSVKPGTPATPHSIDGSSPFSAREDKKWIWLSIIAVLILTALIAGGWFLYSLFSRS